MPDEEEEGTTNPVIILIQCEYDPAKQFLPCTFCQLHGLGDTCIKTLPLPSQGPPAQNIDRNPQNSQHSFIPQWQEIAPSYSLTTESSAYTHPPAGTSSFGFNGTIKCETCRSRRKKVRPIPISTTYRSVITTSLDRTSLAPSVNCMG